MMRRNITVGTALIAPVLLVATAGPATAGAAGPAAGGAIHTWTGEQANERYGWAVAELTALKGDEDLLRSFFHASSLPLPRTLLS